MAELLGIANTLLSVIDTAIQLCDQRKQNTTLAQELHKFFQDLQANIQQLQDKVLCMGCNNSAKWALDALRDDLDGALLEANEILKKGFMRSVWSAPKIQSQIQALRERVMTSFQTRLSVASLDVALEGKDTQNAFQSTMLKVNKDLQEIYFSTSASVKQEMQLALRRELREAVQTLTTAMESQSQGIEVAVSKIRSVHPQTSDTEKFLEDVLAALDGLSVKIQGDAASSAQSGNHKESTNPVKWYQDPVTWDIMVDPVKATDGHTYDRWTIVRGGLVKSPFTLDDPRPFRIAADDLDVRSRLFHKYPNQEVQFKAKRAEYRDAALEEAKLEHFGDAAMMLEHVLEWAPHDLECKEALQCIQHIINGADNSDQPGLDLVDDTSNSVVPDDTKLVARDVSQSSWKAHGDHRGTSSFLMRDETEIQTLSQSLQTNSLDNSSNLTEADEPQLLPPSALKHSATRQNIRKKDNIKILSTLETKLKKFTGLFTKRSNTHLLESSPDGLSNEFHDLNNVEEGAAVPKTESAAGVTIAAVSQPVQSKLVFFEGNKYAYNVKDLLNASAEVLGKGSLGTVYKAWFEDGIIFAVKRLKDFVIGVEDFKQQIIKVGELRHEHLVPFVGYYFSAGENLLVYEYMRNGSLYNLLHGIKRASKPCLDWNTCVKIALGAALGIEFLHSHGFTHGNIKSSNILLTYDYQSCISDCGLGQLGVSATAAMNIIVGYCAPEVKNDWRVTEKADVYSFGVILLELLTGKDPSQDSINDEGRDMPQWVQFLLKEGQTACVFDMKLMTNQAREEEMGQMLKIAMECVATSPDKRPAMKQVVKMLEDLKNW
ncbi:hypothetical protein L7F22_063014 [Adiantum nelumboides]|nr:hypothetical protein [Adiantum nelumboides]